MSESTHRPPGGPTQPPPLTVPDYELLQPIGGGSYGDVWLARNNAGTLRAVKIVARAEFDDDRPYEREYEGLKLFEPLSRQHTSLVEILHLGRNAAAGYFYYIMEVADDASTGQQIDPARYVPRTLKQEIRKRGRLPVAECLAISEALADALAFLHRNGRVHRDLKPANIIFVDGVPKLADIGLVAETGQGRSFVGTEGFVPPEGPGKAQADIYSLGKVIYEMSTGRNIEQFPSPPLDLATSPDRELFLLLNDIISKACEPDLPKRYHSAEELKADLAQVRSGIKPKHFRQHRLGVALASVLLSPRRLASVTAVVLLIPACLLVWHLSHYRLKLAHNLPLYLPPELVAAMTWGCPAHWHGSANADFLFPYQNKLYVVSHEGTLDRPIALEEQTLRGIGVSRVQDIDGNGLDEVFVSWEEAEDAAAATDRAVRPVKLFLSSLNKDGYRRNTFTCPGTTTKHKDFGESPSGIVAERICDLEHNGRRVLLAVVNSTWSKRPRGLWCFDFETQRTNWFFETASPILALNVLDINHDGRNEIVLGTGAPDNSNVIYCAAASQFMSDSNSTLYVLSDRGALLWHTNTGGVFSWVRPLPLGKPFETGMEIVACVAQDYALDQVNRIRNGGLVVFDSRFQPKPGYALRAPVGSCEVVDLDGDGKLKILLTDLDGYLHVLDSRLHLLARQQITARRPAPATHYTHVTLDIAGMLHLGPAPEKQLVLTSSQSELVGDQTWVGNTKSNQPSLFDYNDSVIVLDSKFRVLARRLVNTRRAATTVLGFRAFPVQSSHGPEILVVSGGAQYFKLSRW